MNFEDNRQVERGVEMLMHPDLVETLCGGDKYAIRGRPLLRETQDAIYYHEPKVIELTVEPYRLYVRPELGVGHNHLDPEFRQELVVLACRTPEGFDVLYGVSQELGFAATLLG